MFKKILLIVFGLFLCLVLELAGNVILPDAKLNMLESINLVCREDEGLIWRQRKDLDVIFQSAPVKTNKQGLRNENIRAEKDNAGFRVICLGGSSTFGWGIEQDKAYPAQLERMMNKKHRGEVINAGQIGYSSLQGKLMFKNELLDYSPDIVTFSYVLNDIDGVRFFRHQPLSDSRIISQKARVSGLKQFFSNKRIYFLVKRFFAGSIVYSDRLSALMFKKQYDNSKTRVSEQEYRQNLEEMIAICEQKNIKLIFIVMPINLALPEIAPDSDALGLSEKYYEQALVYLKKKDYENAADFFKKALDYQVFKCQENGSLYQDIMRQVAAERNVVCVDAQKAFAGTELSLFNGVYDRIHPNESGHKIIAQGIMQAITENDLLPEKM